MTQEYNGMARELALPTTFEELSGMARAFVSSGMFQDTKSLSQAIVKIQAGKELGLPPVYSMQNINLIRNRLTSSANTMAMLVKKSGRYNYRIKEHTDEKCTITFYEREGEKWQEVGESTFTMADAKRADLLKPDSSWARYPRAMLWSRAISQGARIYAPDAIGGIYTDEEIRSIPPLPPTSQIDQHPEVLWDDMGQERGKITMPSGAVVTKPAEPVEPLDMDWLKEQLNTDGKKQAARDYIKLHFDVAEKTITESVKKLTPDQQKELGKYVEGGMK